MGRFHLEQIWWLISLFVFLFLLFLNTFCCTISRVNRLLRRRQGLSIRGFLVKLTPSLIHICFIIIISGHFLSEVSGINKVINISQTKELKIKSNKESFQLHVENIYLKRHQNPEVIKGHLKDCYVDLILTNSNSDTPQSAKRVSILSPLLWNGYSIHLKLDKARESNPDLLLQIKKDPGIPYIITGFILMMICMFWYFPQKNKVYQNSRKKEQELLEQSRVYNV